MFVEHLRRAVEASPHVELARVTHAHSLLPLSRPALDRRRSVRRPFAPSQHGGPYRLPHGVRDRLASALAPFRNRDAAFALAVFLGRFWSTPSRILAAFPIDRRAIAERLDLGLTEAKVRGAIRTLERVGFLDRTLVSGPHYQRTGGGELHRKPVLYQFGSDYSPLFAAANRQAQKARGGQGSARPIAPENARRPSGGLLTAPVLNSPKRKGSGADKVLMGEISPTPPEPIAPPRALEAALERWTKAFEESRRS